MSNAELKREFFAIASKIKAVCEHKSVSTCTNGKCPFSTENGACAFDWCNFGSPYDWEFDSKLFVNINEAEEIEQEAKKRADKLLDLLDKTREEDNE